MKRALLVALILPTPLAAQAPSVTLTAAPGLARYSRAAGVDTSGTHGPMVRVDVAGAWGPATLRLGYADAALGNGRHGVAGMAALDIQVNAPLTLGVGVSALADVPATGTPLRWWAVELRGSAQLPMPGTPFVADLALGVGPAGGLNRPDAFGSLVRFEAGLALRLPCVPLALRLGYGLQRAGGANQRDALETVTVGTSWTVRP